MPKKLNLSRISVLTLDCQASGANPDNGVLLEVGWKSGQSAIESRLCRLPEGETIPRRVSRITGLKTEDMEQGIATGTVWRQLVRSAKKIARANGSKKCPTVIHFARYEEPFLRDLHQQNAPTTPFPFEIICTHQVARRLFPNLPRKGLRAIAGFLGHSVPELRRSAHHVDATVFVWERLVTLLGEQGIETLPQLIEWLDKSPGVKKEAGRHYPMDPKVRLGLPNQPGVYRMLRSNGDILYIGKATSLKQRVNSYFQKKGKGHAEHTLEMLTQAHGLDVTVTGSALEAALLETDEIKKHAPPYNVALRQRDRQTVFFTRDLLNSSPKVEENFTVGPLPSVETLSPLSTIIELVAPGTGFANGEDPETPLLALGVGEEYAPELDCFNEGVQLFREQHRQLLNKLAYHYTFQRDPLTGVMSLGRAFHLKRLEELAAQAELGNENDEPMEEEETVEEPAEWVWTPEAVSRALESILRRAALMIRRSRWFCLLSESTLAWNTGPTSGEHRRLLILRGGCVVHRENTSQEKDLPTPPGFQRPMPVRQKSFDIAAYDRMRILTTELRRLAADNRQREISLKVNRDRILGKEQLIKLFQWI